MADGEGFEGGPRDDPRWRLSNLYWITDERGRRVQFEMNSVQADLFDGRHTLNVILKAR